MSSIWSKTVTPPTFPKLKETVNADVLIVGGGLAGILCAHALTKAGLSCVIAEANRICGGTTHNTTAKITAQHGAVYHKMLSRFGEEKTRLYLEANLAAIRKYRSLAQSIDCDFEEKNAYLYATSSQDVLERESYALEKIGFHAAFCKDLPLPFPTSGALCFTEQAQFHPLKFAYALAKDLTVYENTRVLNLEKNHAVTENGEIFARHIIVATHFPFLRLRGLYFLKMHQYRSYISALSHAPQVNGMYLDAEGRGLSLRNYKEFLLLGGGGHPTGAQGGGWETLKIYRKKYFPDAAEVYRFAAQDCVTLDDIPYIGYYGKPSDGMFVATGFNKWGMTSSMVAAELLKDLITEKESPYTEVFSPSRSMVRPRLFLHVGKNTWNLLRPTAPRCPHLGCALRYNSAEHTWDCPCHGSRFTKDGACIDSPANRDHK